jgi:hypothetical protein
MVRTGARVLLVVRVDAKLTFFNILDGRPGKPQCGCRVKAGFWRFPKANLFWEHKIYTCTKNFTFPVGSTTFLIKFLASCFAYSKFRTSYIKFLASFFACM